MSHSTITVLVVDDNLLVRSGLRTLLETSNEFEVIGEASNGEDAIRLTRQLGPDVILLDVRMPVLDGISALGQLTEYAAVIMLTHSEDHESIQEALRGGASGYLVHGSFDIEELSSAIRSVTEDSAPPLSPVAVRSVVSALREPPSNATQPPPEHPQPLDEFGLTSREVEVLDLMSDGVSNLDIAGHLFVSEKTVKNHVTHIYAKLGVSNRAAAIALWHRTRRGQPK